MSHHIRAYGIDLKHITKHQMLEIIRQADVDEKALDLECDALQERIREMETTIKVLSGHQVKSDCTQIPTEELEDVMTEVYNIGNQVKNVLFNRCNDEEKKDCLMSAMLANERIHCFFLGFSPARNAVACDAKKAGK